MIFEGEVPYKGVAWMKYQKTLDEDPEGLAAMSREETDEFVRRAAETYSRLRMELLDSCRTACGAWADPDREMDWNEYYRRIKQADRMADEIALSRALG